MWQANSLSYQKMILLQSKYFENDHPRIPLTINSTHQRPRDVTTQFRLFAKPKLTLLSLSCQQNSLYLLALAAAPRRLPIPRTQKQEQSTFSHANNSIAITSSEATLKVWGKSKPVKCLILQWRINSFTPRQPCQARRSFLSCFPDLYFHSCQREKHVGSTWRKPPD